ncbi:MAG: MFS transporter [Dehalococcoidia bacterium]
MSIADQQRQTPVGVLDVSRRALTIGLLLVVSLVAFEALAVATVMPAAVKDIGGLTLYGWTFSAFMLASLVTTIAAGEQADRRGPAIPFLAGIALFGLGLVVAGLAPSMLLFIAGRALQGGGAGAVIAMAYVGISRGYPDALRARMLALLSSAWVIPGLIGPGVAGVLAEQASWRLVFLGLLPLLVVAAALTLPAFGRMTVDGAGAVAGRFVAALCLAIGTGVFLGGLEIGIPVLAVAVAAVGAGLAVPALLRLTPPGIFTARPGLPAGLATSALLNFGFFAAEAFMPLGLTSLRGLSTSEAGVMLTIASLTWTGGAWVQARLDTQMQGRGRRERVTIGVALAAAGIVVMALTIVWEQIPVGLAGIGWGIGGLGMGLAYPTISLIVLAQAPAGKEGSVSGSLRVAELLSVALGTGLGGAVIAFGDRMGWPEEAGIAVAFGIALCGSAIGILASRRLPGRNAAAQRRDATLSVV